jgi:3-oxoacyl-[acyl-carrier protein] reductase
MTIPDRVVLVTGSRRIGAEVSVELSRRGATVAIAYNRARESAERAAAAIQAVGGRAVVVQADVAIAADCRRLVAETVDRCGRLDVLVNMASLYEPVSFDALDEAAFDRHVAVDLKGAYLCSIAAVPEMRRQGGGRIVNISDWLALAHRPRYLGYLPYYIAKAGVIALTEAMALELAADGILVNAIAPGPILPPAGLPPEEAEAVVRATPVGRWGGPAEIAKAVVMLIESDFITGEVIRVDGGRHLR